MKIVQSFWTKPGLKKDNFNSSDRNNGGWVDKKYNYMSWALSCLQFTKYYKDVELVTDKDGYELLINRLGLPYSKVSVVLDDLNEYHPDLWALGKVYAYGLQDSPFIHADGDIFIYEKFGDHFESSPLLAQNIEEGFNFYNEVFKHIQGNFSYMPAVLFDSIQRNNYIISVNAGIIGGTDVEFFKDFTKSAFEFVDRNVEHIAKVNTGMFNTIFEQFLFHALAEAKQKEVNYFVTSINHAFDGLAEFTGTPGRIKYVHTVGVYKKIKHVADLLACRLLNDYPDFYYRIINLIRTNQI